MVLRLMATILFKGNPIRTVGDLPQKGQKAPAFSLVKTDLSAVSSQDLAGKKVVLNIFPSIDTRTCPTSVPPFHKRSLKHHLTCRRIKKLKIAVFPEH